MSFKHLPLVAGKSRGTFFLKKVLAAENIPLYLEHKKMPRSAGYQSWFLNQPTMLYMVYISK